MEKRDTLRGLDLRGDRSSGRSTKQVDYAIDLFFKGYLVEVRDHSCNGKDNECNRVLFDRVIRRLESEHSLKSLIFYEAVEINEDNLTLSYHPDRIKHNLYKCKRTTIIN